MSIQSSPWRTAENQRVVVCANGSIVRTPAILPPAHFKPHSQCAGARALPLMEGQCVAVRARTMTRVRTSMQHMLIHVNGMHVCCKMVIDEVVDIV